MRQLPHVRHLFSEQTYILSVLPAWSVISLDLLTQFTMTTRAFITLNALRAASIVALLLVVASSVVMLVKTKTVSQLFFFDAVSHVIAAGISCE